MNVDIEKIELLLQDSRANMLLAEIGDPKTRAVLDIFYLSHLRGRFSVEETYNILGLCNELSKHVNEYGKSHAVKVLKSMFF